MKGLTKIQERYHDWLLRMTLKNHNFPTRQEAAEHFGVNLSAALFHIMALERKKLIERVPGSPKYKFVDIKLVIAK